MLPHMHETEVAHMKKNFYAVLLFSDTQITLQEILMESFRLFLEREAEVHPADAPCLKP